MCKEQEIDAAWAWYDSINAPRVQNLSAVRLELARQQDWLCFYCQREMTEGEGIHRLNTDVTVDHKTPVSKGGTDNTENLVASCARCNNEKSDMDFDAYMRWIGR